MVDEQEIAGLEAADGEPGIRAAEPGIADVAPGLAAVIAERLPDSVMRAYQNAPCAVALLV